MSSFLSARSSYFVVFMARVNVRYVQLLVSWIKSLVSCTFTYNDWCSKMYYVFNCFQRDFEAVIIASINCFQRDFEAVLESSIYYCDDAGVCMNKSYVCRIPVTTQPVPSNNNFEPISDSGDKHVIKNNDVYLQTEATRDANDVKVLATSIHRHREVISYTLTLRPPRS